MRNPIGMIAQYRLRRAPKSFVVREDALDYDVGSQCASGRLIQKKERGALDTRVGLLQQCLKLFNAREAMEGKNERVLQESVGIAREPVGQTGNCAWTAAVRQCLSRGQLNVSDRVLEQRQQWRSGVLVCAARQRARSQRSQARVLA